MSFSIRGAARSLSLGNLLVGRLAGRWIQLALALVLMAAGVKVPI
jgi:hypothetical protein